MLSIVGRPYRHCDGLTRRRFLAAGSLGFAGLTLADLLRAEAAAGTRSSHKAVINVHLDGGPPQLDTIDLKPQAPVELRGDFRPIATRLPGVQVCELLPKIAQAADKFVFIRTLVGSAGQHNAFQCQSGFDEKELQSIGGRPAMGSVLARLRGLTADAAPSFVDLMQGRPLVRNSARPGFLGPAYQPFRPDISRWFHRELEPGMKGELARRGADHATSLTLNPALDARRINDRTDLLGGLDTLRREIDATGMMDALDRFQQQAISILTSGRFADALDLSKEDPRVLERYTPPASQGERFYTAEDHLSARKFLLARRLVEAGVRCVSISISDFDTHSGNFPRMRQLLPIVDHGLATLVGDLEERGLLGDVLIVAWGEFGRTPRINKNGGRDHWPRVSPALLAGGGLRTGVVLGETDRTASAPVSRPVHFQDVFATLYHKLGLDLRATTIADTRGRPQYLVDQGTVIPEVA
jgi:hypothetical protein